jgi:beta-1,4-mannosyltransferase
MSGTRLMRACRLCIYAEYDKNINVSLEKIYEEMATRGIEVHQFRYPFLPKARSVIHINFPDAWANGPSLLVSFVKCCSFLVSLLVGHLRRSNIVWTVHNLESHESRHPWLERMHMSAVIALVDGVIISSQMLHAGAIKRFPALASKPNAIIPLPDYREMYPPPVTKEAARSMAGIPVGTFVILCFGMVRRYKNFDQLCRCFVDIGMSDCLLVMGGFPVDLEYTRELTLLTSNLENVRCRFERVPESELPILYGAADLVVAPFRDVTNSGSVVLALTYDVPTLAPNKGSLPGLQEQIGSDWLMLYDADLTPDTLRRAIKWVKTTPRAPSAPKDFMKLDNVTTKMLTFFERLHCQSN